MLSIGFLVSCSDQEKEKPTPKPKAEVKKEAPKKPEAKKKPAPKKDPNKTQSRLQSQHQNDSLSTNQEWYSLYVNVKYISVNTLDRMQIFSRGA